MRLHRLTTRPRGLATARLGARAVMASGLAGGALLLAGCGGGGVDRGGFTAKNRQDAQAVLDTLATTSVPTTLFALTTTADKPPAACKVHLVSSNPVEVSLFIWWIPYQPHVQAVSYTYFNATLVGNTVEDRFHVSFSSGLASARQAFAQHAPRATYQKPVENCEVLESGNVRLLPA